MDDEGEGRTIRTYNVVIVGSPNVNAGYKLVRNLRIRRSRRTMSGGSGR